MLKIKLFPIFLCSVSLVTCAFVQPAWSAEHRTLIIATPGLASPDGLDIMDYPNFFAISDRGCVFSTRLQNAEKQVVYSVTHEGTKEVVRTGTIIPNQGEVTSLIGQLATNDRAETVIYVGLKGADGVTRDALIAGNSVDNLRLIAREDDATPDQNGQFNSYSPGVLNHQGDVAFWAAIKNGGGPISSTNGAFIKHADGAMTQVLRSQQLVPGESYPIHNINTDVKMFPHGQILFSASVIEPPSGTSYRLYRRNSAGSLILAARSDQAAPGTPYFISDPGYADMNNAGEVAFYAPIEDSNGIPQGFGIFKGSSSTTLSPIALSGQGAPDSLGTFNSFDNSLNINKEGHVAFVSALTGGSTSAAVLVHDNIGARVIAKTATQAPGGATYTGFGHPRINDNGVVMYAAQLNGNQTYQGIYLSDGIDTIKVAQAGDTINGKSITEIGIDPKAFNAGQQVAYQARLSGDTASSILLFAPRLKWRSLEGGNWHESARWTASLTPAEYNDVDIIPDDGVTIMGPVEPVTVGSLTLGANESGVTDLNLQETGPITATGGMLILSRGQLSGNGTIIGDVTNHAMMSPGNSPGEVTIEGDYIQEDEGTLNIEIAGTSPGSYDQLFINGSAMLNGSLTLNVIPGSHDTLVLSDALTITSATGGINGGLITVVDNEWVQTEDGLGYFLIEFDANQMRLTDYKNADSDNDGIPDFWMLENFGQTTSDSVPEMQADYDADGDGMNNVSEYIAGTDPREKSSTLRAAIQNRSVSFQSVSGRKYDIEYSADLVEWSKVETNIPGDGLLKTVPVTSEDPERGFYRVIVKR